MGFEASDTPLNVQTFVAADSLDICTGGLLALPGTPLLFATLTFHNFPALANTSKTGLDGVTNDVVPAFHVPLYTEIAFATTGATVTGVAAGVAGSTAIRGPPLL